MSTNTIIDAQQVPVVTQDDVAAEWSDDVCDPSNPPPIISAIQAGQMAMLLRYQQAAAYAAEQSDPARSTDEYADETGGERGVYRKPGESDTAYHARTFNQRTVDPNDIVAVANAVLAPFTTKSCVYFEHSDALFQRSDYLDVIDASNTTPIQVTVRTTIPSTILSGSTVTVSLVVGNTAANGTWPVTILMGPMAPLANTLGIALPAVTLSGTATAANNIEITITGGGVVGGATFTWRAGTGPISALILVEPVVALPGTGLAANFSPGFYPLGAIYASAPAALSLTGSAGNGQYTGSGSLLPSVSDSSLHPSLWSSHVWGATRWNTQNYPDRYYAQIADRFSCGARMFSDATGRLFWLVAPDISGIDNSVAAQYAGFLDVIDATNTTPIIVRTRYPVPPSFVNGQNIHVLGVTGNAAANGGPFVGTLTSQNTISLSDQTGAPIVGNGLYAGGGSIYRDTPFPADGFFQGGTRNLPGQVFLSGANSPQTLDATHTVGLVDVSAPIFFVTLNLPASPTAGMVVVAVDTTGFAAAHPITVSGNGHVLADPLTGVYAASIVLHTNYILAMWVWNAGATRWDIFGVNATFVFSISATASIVYDDVVAAVEAIRAHSIRWGFTVDKRLN